jgi:uncharacterized protein (DUF885 family)
LPDGKAWYAFNAKQSTTTAQTPEQIHEIGLKEVERIRRDPKVMAEVGFKGSLQDFFSSCRTTSSSSSSPSGTAGALPLGLRPINANVPKLFSLTPKAGFEIARSGVHAPSRLPVARTCSPAKTAPVRASST